MRVLNVHAREFACPMEEVGRLVQTLATGSDDRLWPVESWPPMRLDHGLQIGSRGGHGPIRYRVVEASPAGKVTFEFTPQTPFATGLEGVHFFEVIPGSRGGTVLRHVLEGEARGAMILKWPLIIRPLHDALVEEALDKAAFELTGKVIRVSYSPWVRFLRWTLRAPHPNPSPAR